MMMVLAFVILIVGVMLLVPLAYGLLFKYLDWLEKKGIL